MLDQGLAIDAHALLARAADRLVRLLAGDVHDIERHAGLVGDHDGAVRRLAFHLRRPRISVCLRPVVAFGKKLLLQEGDDIAVLGMHQRQRAELRAARERGEHLVVVHHQRTLVGHEVLEGVDALLDHFRHLVEDLAVPPGNRHVEGVVGARLAGLLVPLLERVEQALLRRRQAEVNDHRRAAGKRGGSSGVEVVGGMGAHEGHFHVRVRIDAAGHHVTAGRIEDMVGGVIKVRADSDDLVVLHEDIGLGGEIGGDDRSAFNEFAHVISPHKRLRGNRASLEVLSAH